MVNSPTEGKLTQLLRSRGLTVYNINLQRAFRVDSAVKLARVIKKERIELIHSHVPLGATILSRLAGKLVGVPVINHVHASYAINLNTQVRWYHFVLNWITSRFFCAAIIAVSEFVKKEAILQGSAAEKIVVIPNGIDVELFAADNGRYRIRQEFGIAPDQVIIGHVSRLGEDKGQHVLIRAAQSVIQRIPNIVFMCVGEDLTRGGAYKKLLEELTCELAVQEKFIFPGYRADINDFMDAFDVCVLPSLFQEGMPVVILEAMAAKRPVIASLGGGIPEIVVDGQNGTLIPPDDPGALATALMYHLKNLQLSQQMGENGYERVTRCFSLEAMLEKVFLHYDAVLNTT